MSPVPGLPVHYVLQEPELLFDPEHLGERHVHPLKGLMAHGPYSQALVNSALDPIRLAVIAPAGFATGVDALIGELRMERRAQERRDYLIDYPGMSRALGIGVNSASNSCRVELPDSLDAEIAYAEKPHLLLADRLNRALSTLDSQRSHFDVLLVFLPDKWERCFHGEAGDDFDLHDYIKAVTASRGIPSQVLLEGKVLRYPCRASVMWRLAIALYCKAGGVPWKLADSEPDTAYVGLSYALRPASNDGPRFVTCCSQVFDSDGAGLEFVVYETDEVHVERDNPFLSRSEMRRVMARSLALYQRRHAGRAPAHIVVHKTTEFKPEEVDGCFDGWGAASRLDLVQITQDVEWRGIQIDRPRSRGGKAEPSAYPCQRGSYLQLGGRDVLLWTQGNAPAAAGGRNFYKEGKGIPAPLLLTRFAGQGGWDASCRAVLGLTKMDWNNDGLYDRLPVTIGYASVLARTVRRMPELHSTPYELRFFM